MANRRMFSLDVVNTDQFLDLPLSSQALYFHLGMRADDDGFVPSPKRITAMVGANQDDLKLLIVKRYVIALDGGIIVIRHWKQNNYIQKDRYNKTIYQEQLSLLDISSGVYELDTSCIQSVHDMDTQVRLGKDSIVKDKNTMCKTDVLALFESLWKLYPCKKGKGQVSEKAKKRLAEIGADEMKRAINRYVEDLQKDSWRKPQNGSTFFTSGYVDYLDANYGQHEEMEYESDTSFKL